MGERIVEHFVFTHNLKIALVILYSVIFFLLAGVKLIAVIFKKDMDNMWIRLKSFFVIVLFFTLAFCFNKITAFLFLILISYIFQKMLENFCQKIKNINYQKLL